MVFGTFDGLHPGHLNFFRQARKLYDAKTFLVASVARDENVLRIKKKLPRRNQKERIKLLKQSKLVNKVILAGDRNHLPHILREQPDIIALGYDQKAYVRNLRKNLEQKGLKVKIVRLKPYKKHIFKNSLLQNHSRVAE